MIAQASLHICAVSSESLLFAHIIDEPRHEKTCLQVRLKQDCSASLEIFDFIAKISKYRYYTI